MVRTLRIGPPVLALALASSLWAQGPTRSPLASPYGTKPVTKASPVITPRAPASAPQGGELKAKEPAKTPSATPPAPKVATEPTKSMPATAAAPKPGERLITVQELNRPPLTCRILNSWHLPDGSLAHEVQVVEGGERMTIVESESIAVPASPGRPRLRAVATRIYHWGESLRRPAGVPEPTFEMIATEPQSVSRPAVAKFLTRHSKKSPVAAEAPTITSPYHGAQNSQWPSAHAGNVATESKTLLPPSPAHTQQEPSMVPPKPGDRKVETVVTVPTPMTSPVVVKPETVVERPLERSRPGLGFYKGGVVERTREPVGVPVKPQVIEVVEQPAPSVPKETIVEVTPAEPRRPVMQRLFPRDRRPVAVPTEVAKTPTKPSTQPEPSKTFVEKAPAARTPTQSPEAADWRKSWGKVDPKKLEEPTVARTSEKPVAVPEVIPTKPVMAQSPVVKPEAMKPEAVKPLPPTVASVASQPVPPSAATEPKKTETAKAEEKSVKPAKTSEKKGWLLPFPAKKPEAASAENKAPSSSEKPMVVANSTLAEKAKELGKQPEPVNPETAKAEQGAPKPPIAPVPVDAAASKSEKDKEKKHWWQREPKHVEEAKAAAKTPKTDETERRWWKREPKKDKTETAQAKPQRNVETSKASDWGAKGTSGTVLPDRLPRAHTQPENDPLSKPGNYVKTASVSESAKPKTPAASSSRSQADHSSRKFTQTSAKDGAPVSTFSPAKPVPSGELPPGVGSVIASGNTKYVPVPIVTVPNPNTPPVVVPQAPQPNVHVNHGIAPGVPPPGYANAFTKPGPQRPVPAETTPPIDSSNAFSDVMTGPGTPPPPVPALASYVPGARQPAPAAAPSHGLPPNVIAQGAPPQMLPPAMQHQPIVPPNPQLPTQPHQPLSDANQGVPGVAWMSMQGRFIPANYYAVDTYGMPMNQAMAGYQQSMMPQVMMQQMMMQQMMMQQQMMQQQMVQQAGIRAQQGAATAPQQPAEEANPVNGLLQMLRESDYPSQREWAADQLSNSRWQSSPQVVSALVTAAKDDPAPMVRTGCVRALTRMQVNTLPVTNVLQQLENDTDLRVRDAVKDARIALGIQSAKPAK